MPNERDGTDSYGTYFRSALHIRQHVNELQLDYAYVAPQQLSEANALDQYRVLFLPFTVAVSADVVEALDAYVRRGGVLVGDLRCLRTDEHGKPVADSAHLQRLFGVERASGSADYRATAVSVERTACGIDLTGTALSVFGREAMRATNATALGAHTTGEPALLVRQQGKGVTVYLNFSLPAYDVAVRGLLGAIVERAGVSRLVAATNPAGGAPPRCYERNTFSKGQVLVHAFIRDHRRCEDSEPVRFAFGTEAHVYDVRAGEYRGFTGVADAVVPPGHTALYACLPYRVTGLRVGVPGEAVAGSSPVAEVTVDADGGPVGDHVVHLDVLGADGEPVWHHARNVLAPGGKLRTSIPLAINDRPGPWRLRARDVLTGTEAEAGFVVSTR